jgi:hypothetical protein
MMPDEHVPTDDQSESAACWAELRTAMQELETSMTDLQDAVTGLDSAFATVESAVDEHETVPLAAGDTAATSDSVAGD